MDIREFAVKPLGCALVVVMGLMTAEAAAGVKTVVKVDTYRITGDSGEALMQAMDRKGPRHGFLTRAIAQTRYSVAWTLGWSVEDRRCRLKSADVVLSVNYRFPTLSGPTPAALKARWAKFMIGVRKHEETHGRIARQMAARAQKTVLKVAVDDDPSCWKAKRRVSEIVHSIYADYEARQQRFDALEHQPGGPVDKLVGALTKRR